MYLLSDILATLQVMVSIGKDLRLHNRNNTILERLRGTSKRHDSAVVS